MRRSGVVAGLLLCIAIASGQSAGTAPVSPIPSWAIGPFTRPATGNPVISPDPKSAFEDPIRQVGVHWEALHTFNPAAVVRAGKVYVLYRAEDDTGEMQIGMHTSRLGLAESADGIHFNRSPHPVFYPAEDGQKQREWPGGVEDPRIVESPAGGYVLTYTRWNRQTYSVGIATSPDLLHWTKYGPAFNSALNGKYADLQYKSAGIVTKIGGDRLIAARIQGKFWMYWGEGSIRLATSSDLIHWTPVEDASGKPLELLRPRTGHFDSTFPETGPPPVLTQKGVVVLYNGKNAASGGDPDLGAGAYAAGEALFSAKNPSRLLARTDNPVLKPALPYEKTGQYAAGTTFAEALVLFHGRWFLYYGCADSLVAVATAPAFIQPGERTGKFRLGGDSLLMDGQAPGRISAEDYAIALVDELEQPKHSRQRFTIAY
jgi:beta-1,2-mannosidase